MTSEALGFRLGAILATRFTGTLTERQGRAQERIPTADQLLEWLAQAELPVEGCSASEFQRVRVLREAIHRAATAAAVGAPLPDEAVDLINSASHRGSATPILTPDRSLQWHLGSPPSIDAALGVIAADAVTLLSGTRAGAFALCASPTCRAAFFDTSRSRTRRWCDMNTCGNHEKKARLRAKAV